MKHNLGLGFSCRQNWGKDKSGHSPDKACPSILKWGSCCQFFFTVHGRKVLLILIVHTTNYIYLESPGQDESTGVFKYSVQPIIPKQSKKQPPPLCTPLFFSMDLAKSRGPTFKVKISGNPPKSGRVASLFAENNTFMLLKKL